MSKTPRFDAALDAILANLQPHERMCRVTSERFRIDEGDIEMYRLLRVPPPTTSPWYRNLRRLCFSPFAFHQSSCAKTGRAFVGVYRRDSPFTVYHRDVWWSDAWDPKEYARAIDIASPFFSQWEAFSRTVPRLGATSDSASVNSEYTIGGKAVKDCYYVRAGAKSEDILYSVFVIASSACIDAEWIDQCERCYDALRMKECYRVSGSCDVQRSRESSFLFDASDCISCFGGFNLRNRKFVFLGEQLDAETYRQKRRAITLGNRSTYLQYRQWYDRGLREIAVHPFSRQDGVERCIGTGIANSSGCHYAFEAFDCLNCRYIARTAINVRDSADIASGGFGIERSYEDSSVIAIYAVKFSSSISTGRDLEYCMDCNNCECCFGCMGLRNARFCILNRQYTEDEYWERVDALKAAMLERGEYGEFFPARMASIPYEDSRAAFDYSNSILSEARERFGLWTIGDDPVSQGEPYVPPDDIRDATDTILTETFRCRTTRRSFRITPQELAFLRREDFPLPDQHPDERMHVRHSAFPEPMRLYERACTQCGTKDLSDIPPNDPRQHVLCLVCYRKAVD